VFKVERLSEAIWQGSTSLWVTDSPTPEQAQDALSENEEYGSSAGGEQPKFTTPQARRPSRLARNDASRPRLLAASRDPQSHLH